MHKTFSISDAMSFGWDTFKTNWKFWLIVFFLAGMGTMGGGGGSSFRNTINNNGDSKLTSFNDTRLAAVLGSTTVRSVAESTAAAGTPKLGMWLPILGIIAVPFALVIISFVIFSILVSTTVRMGYINLLIDAGRGKQVYYRTILNQVSLKRAGRFIAATFMAGFITVIGLLFFIIPGIYFALRFAFVGMALVDGDLTSMEALKKSSEVTKGIKFKLLGLALALVLITLVVTPLTFGVGLLIMSIVSSLAYAYVYAKMAEQSLDQTPGYLAEAVSQS